MIWREKRVLLIILGVLLAANTIFFFTYRVQYQNRLQALEDRLSDAEGRLQRARNGRRSIDQQIAGYRKVQTDLDALYNDRWSTKPQRLTSLIVEVKRLTAASQLVPPSVAFTNDVERAKVGGAAGTSTVGITFTVQGTYQQIRRLINLLELSDQFVIIEGIGLAGTGANETLTLNLRLKTIFREPAPGAINRSM
jgi:hypothetical protein